MERIIHTIVRSSRARQRGPVILRQPWPAAGDTAQTRRPLRPSRPAGGQPLRVREVMPPHDSPNFTYEQAIEGWRRLEESRRRRREASGDARREAPPPP